MERYTEKHYTGNGHYLLCSGTCETLNCGDCGILDKIVDRLAAYEDTGLTPEEVQQMRWIPVEERMPDAAGEYLVVYHPCHWDSVSEKICVGIDSFRGKTAWAKKKYQRVTHWTPLPKPPKEVTHEK